MTSELGCEGKLSEFVSNHLFRDVDGRELFAVMNSEGETDEFWWDVAIASPRLDDLLLLFCDHIHNLPEKLRIYVRAFFERASHGREK